MAPSAILAFCGGCPRILSHPAFSAAPIMVAVSRRAFFIGHHFAKHMDRRALGNSFFSYLRHQGFNPHF